MTIFVFCINGSIYIFWGYHFFSIKCLYFLHNTVNLPPHPKSTSHKRSKMPTSRTEHSITLNDMNVMCTPHAHQLHPTCHPHGQEGSEGRWMWVRSLQDGGGGNFTAWTWVLEMTLKSVKCCIWDNYVWEVWLFVPSLFWSSVGSESPKLFWLPEQDSISSSSW